MIQIGFNNKYLKLIVVDEAVLETSELLETEIRAKVVALNKNGLKLIPLLDDIHALVCITNIEEKDKKFETLEKFRILGNKVFKKLAEFKLSEINIAFDGIEKNLAFAFIEGLLLSTYTFKKYKKEDKKSYEFSKIYASDEIITESEAEELQNIIEANFSARTLVNEPLSYLTAEKYSQEIEKIGKKAKFKTTILDKGQIETLKMAGVLAVNKGSFFPPTFNILEYKPKDAINKAPIILVGKGVVYDTGGMSIKTGNGMETMKCDMAGSAAVVGAFQAVAKNKLPIYIVGLIPAVENRINEHAIVPGDIITYNNGTSVEVLNTDAEGRLILADALLYAQKYNPMLVIDLATLTGSAMRAIGTHGIVYMGNAERKTKKSIEKSGLKLSERLVEFPLWFEYEEDLKSSIADINNLGGPTAGAIIGGMFLKHFVDYPWLHLDIAAPAYNTSELNYRGTGGSAVGVRLIYSFLKKEIQRWQNEAIESELE